MICMEHESHTYRTDVDGRRAVAVALIVIFHVSPTAVPGGFVWVDVFFVISGFLIFQRLKRDILNGSFSFAEFYKLRVRRIFPACVLCIYFTMIASWFIMEGTYFRQAIEGSVASAISGANFYFLFFVPVRVFRSWKRLESCPSPLVPCG